MKHSKPLCLLTVSCLFPMISCVNNVGEKGGSIPISISPNVEGSKTRVADTSFEQGDAVGLYVMKHTEKLDGNRHVDNQKYTYSTTNGMIPKDNVYFPQDIEKFDFISYHPYKSKAVSEGETTIEVTVKNDQRGKDYFSQSDFLVARKEEVSASKEKVALTYKHKLYRMNIKIKATEEFSLDDLLDADPAVTITNVYTKAVFDFEEDKFSSLSGLDDIRTNGDWKKEGEVLTGKCAIIIPQTISNAQSLIKVEMGGRTFRSSLAAENLAKSGEAEDYTLTLKESVTVAVSPGIDGWESAGGKNLEANETITTTTFIALSDLSFYESNVYHILANDGSAVGEVCKEYLLASGIAGKAIVFYPMKEGKADLTKGTVLQLIDKATNVHGGSVVWNANNTLTYTAGSQASIDRIYINQDRELGTGEDDFHIAIKAEEYVLEDRRDSEILTYPITKIATQYWLRSNLACTRYKDGTPITAGTDFSETSAKYCTPDNENFFYNATAIANPLLVPDGWRISNKSDWNTLKTYTGSKASFVKKGTEWLASTFTADNQTGFDALVTQYYAGTGAYIGSSETVYARYWYMQDSDPKKVESSILLGSNSDEFKEYETTSSYLGLSVRLVRK